MYILAENKYYKWVYKVTGDGLQLIYTSYPTTELYLWKWDVVSSGVFNHFTWDVLTESEVFILIL